ncbi:MAG TPA: hypothetical protein VFC39_18160 [Acidobacteriaceae bacterium]|nr:hypothetical protein [Acidobacteriaceae bacterium]
MSRKDDPKASQEPETTPPTVGAVGFISSLVYGATSQLPAPGAGSVGVPLTASRSTGRRTIACMVTHGMGQQVPFETAASIAEAFVRGRPPQSKPQANRVRLSTAPDSELVSRMELIYAAQNGEPETHVHIYEGYWAPLTEGKITYVQALSFLFSGAWSGIVTTITRKFDRWIFGRMYDLPPKKHTLFILVAVLLVLAAGLLLAFLCGVELTHFYASLKNLAKQPLLQLPAYLEIIFLTHWRGLIRTALLVVIAFIYRYFLNLFVIEYLGDVAIYVSSYKVSAFEEIRNAIQKKVVTVGQQIFQAADPVTGAPLYDGVIFVGHSLGSVVTYDLINALIVWDTQGCSGQHNVVGRIHRFITFGSPLDKTAFLFRNQTSKDHHYREAMAGLMQALVLDYNLRPFLWVNLFSHADIVSGALEYYDTPTTSRQLLPNRNPIRSKTDPSAWIPLYAHIQYWKGKALSRQLLAGLAPSDVHSNPFP